MGKIRFNEPELFLLKRWGDVKLFNECLDGLLKKYEDVYRQVVGTVRQKHPELESEGIHPQRNGGQVGIGRRSWPSMYDRWPSGFWLSEIDFDHLSSDGKEPQWATIWLKPPTNMGFDLTDATRKIQEAANRIMTAEHVGRCYFGEEGTCLMYQLPESQDLLAMLLKDQSEDFVTCLVSHFDLLAKFTPVIDEIFRPRRTKK